LIPIAIETADEVHVPAGYDIHFHVTSADVIHSFWTPQVQRQIDANPGIDNAVFTKLQTPGIYSGACYEYCGEAHAWMKFRTVVENLTDFKAWVRSQEQLAVKPTTSEQKSGEKVFFSNTCLECHAISGTSAGGVVGPNLTHVASRWTIGAGALAMSRANLEIWIRNPDAVKPGVLMPPYPLISEKDMKALTAYLFSLK
jgi:cytochrome c oxidase subunit 2